MCGPCVQIGVKVKMRGGIFVKTSNKQTLSSSVNNGIPDISPKLPQGWGENIKGSPSVHWRQCQNQSRKKEIYFTTKQIFSQEIFLWTIYLSWCIIWDDTYGENGNHKMNCLKKNSDRVELAIDVWCYNTLWKSINAETLEAVTIKTRGWWEITPRKACFIINREYNCVLQYIS